MKRFPDRFAGSADGVFEVPVFNADGSPRDLTNASASATFTFRRQGGGIAAVDEAADTGTPGTAGLFVFQATPAQLSSPDEYVVTIAMTISGELRVERWGFRILPAI